MSLFAMNSKPDSLERDIHHFFPTSLNSQTFEKGDILILRGWNDIYLNENKIRRRLTIACRRTYINNRVQIQAIFILEEVHHYGVIR